MSTRKGRSIRHIDLSYDQTLKSAKTPTANHYFGEKVIQNEPPILEERDTRRVTHSSSDDSLDLLLTGIRDLGQSSSSSLSWGDSCDRSEASQHVRQELERMDRVLRGEEPIPDNYDEDEYREWMEFFPDLTVTGVGLARPVVSAVPRAPPPRGGTGVKLAKRQLSSSRSLISSELSSSKWLKDYSCLPFVDAKKAPKPLRGILKTGGGVVLPPIEGHQFRSVSATPRRGKSAFYEMSARRQFRTNNLPVRQRDLQQQ